MDDLEENEKFKNYDSEGAIRKVMHNCEVSFESRTIYAVFNMFITPYM